MNNTNEKTYTFVGWIGRVVCSERLPVCDRCGSGLINSAVCAVRDNGVSVYLGPDCAASVKITRPTKGQWRMMNQKSRDVSLRALAWMERLVVDAAITEAQALGIEVPADLGPNSYWYERHPLKAAEQVRALIEKR
jgi:hypothetical protein